ncbi:MAG: POTRA domain-containing protein, partial [Bacteroidota bacterium]
MLTSLLSGCYGTKYLESNQRLLMDQKIKGAAKTQLEDLETNFTQKTARRLSLTTRLYQWGEKSYNPEKYSRKITKIENRYNERIADTKKTKRINKLRERKLSKTRKFKDKIQFGNTLMQWGKPLAIYDQNLTEKTVSNIHKKLNSEGYFNNVVTYEERLKKKKAYVTYLVEPKNPYIIDSVNYIIPDQDIKKLVMKDKLINTDQRYRQNDLTRERERIRTLLANKGYYAFSKQYVSFQADTTFTGNQKVLVNVRISNPKGKENHQVYQLDSVIFVSETDAKIRGVKRRQRSHKNITYDYIRDIYSNKILDWRIFIYPDSTYSEARTFETQKQLSNMNNFKFINVKYDTTGGDFIAHIFTSPLKRFETSSEIGINSREGFPGPFVNFGLINRNTFEGLENVDLNFNLEVIGLNRFAEDTTTTQLYDSYEYGGNITFSFPQFLLPLNKPLKSRLGKYNPTTLVSGGISFVDRSDFTRNTFNTSITYNWQTPNNITRYSLTLADIRFISSEIAPLFQERLDSLEQRGNTFARSFDPGFVSSTIFSFTKDIKEYGNLRQPSSFLRGYAEIGGNLFDLFSETPFGNDISYYKFLKASIDYRHHIPLGSKTALAFRVNSGFAFPYGTSAEGTNPTLPYEKFFFAGGSNSIKAWQPR